MKSIYTLAALAVMATVGTVNAQAPEENICVRNQAANAAVIAQAQAAATPTERQAILRRAINANPANAVCIADLALQMSLNIDPAAGPDDFTAGDTPTTTDGTAAPAENPSQLNQNGAVPPASAAVPAI